MKGPYSNLRGVSGVYCLFNTVTLRRYVGQSTRLSARLQEQFRYLRRGSVRYGNRANRRLQEEYDTYGETSFQVQILEVCPPEVLVNTEKKWMDFYQTLDPRYGYNMQLSGDGPRLPTEEVRNLMSQIRRTLPGHPTSEKTKALLAERARGRPAHPKLRTYAIGRVMSPETRAKISAAHKGRKHTVEARAAIASAQRIRRAKEREDLQITLLANKDRAEELLIP